MPTLSRTHTPTLHHRLRLHQFLCLLLLVTRCPHAYVDSYAHAFSYSYFLRRLGLLLFQLLLLLLRRLLLLLRLQLRPQPFAVYLDRHEKDANRHNVHRYKKWVFLAQGCIFMYAMENRRGNI